MAMTRREVVVGVGAVMAAGAAKAQVPTSQNRDVGHPAQGPESMKGAGDLAEGSKVFAMGAVAGVKQASGAERKNVFDGKLVTGETISAHESAAPAGTPAGVAHVIKHSEFIVVMEGTMEFFHDGKTDIAKAGDVMYVAYGTNHQVRNVGDGVARYLVFQVSGDTK